MSRRGLPTTAELLEAVREYLGGEVAAMTTGAARFNARVAGNLLATVERELALLGDWSARHAERLAAMGVASDDELAAAIRDGRLADRAPELVRRLRDTTRERMAMENPRYLTAEDRALLNAEEPPHGGR